MERFSPGRTRAPTTAWHRDRLKLIGGSPGREIRSAPALDSVVVAIAAG
jgi:hypothetical protein